MLTDVLRRGLLFAAKLCDRQILDYQFDKAFSGPRSHLRRGGHFQPMLSRYGIHAGGDVVTGSRPSVTPGLGPTHPYDAMKNTLPNGGAILQRDLFRKLIKKPGLATLAKQITQMIGKGHVDDPAVGSWARKPWGSAASWRHKWHRIAATPIFSQFCHRRPIRS